MTSASGGPWGGTCVDTSFRDFMVEVFSKRVLELFEKYDELEFQRKFELKKRAFKKERETTVLSFSSALFDIYAENVSEDFTTRLRQKHFSDTVEKKRDKLLIKSSKFQEFFREPKEKVVAFLQSILSKNDLRHVQTLLLVGGFAECDVMSDAVKEAFPDKHVIVPTDAGIAVMKGLLCQEYTSGILDILT